MPFASPRLAALAAAPALSANSSQVAVTGAVITPTTLDYGALAALPAVQQTDTFLAGTASQTHLYTGTSVWGVLNGAGIVTHPAAHNDILNRYVLATGSDGYQVVFSLGELNPNFGNRPDLLAYQETIGTTTAPLTADGVARFTAPGDVKGGRYVSNLVDLDVRASGSAAPASGGGPSTSFTVGGAAAASSRSFDLGALAALPQVSETVGGHVYTGVGFWDLLNRTVGIVVDPSVKNDVLGKYAVATGSDGYKVVFSLGELDPSFGNQPDLIATSIDGAALGADGFARIVVPGDVRAGRWVSDLTSIEILSAAPIPEPEAWALMLAGAAAVAAKARRPRAAD